tara:strand:- start:251 stop:661 length:411 start_codon:yes stop_codon:yes gene_type:complete
MEIIQYPSIALSNSNILVHFKNSKGKWLFLKYGNYIKIHFTENILRLNLQKENKDLHILYFDGFIKYKKYSLNHVDLRLEGLNSKIRIFKHAKFNIFPRLKIHLKREMIIGKLKIHLKREMIIGKLKIKSPILKRI